MAKVQLGNALSDQQIEDIVLFLKSLTWQIPDDILQVPLLPPGE
jgi:hypothetical protein